MNKFQDIIDSQSYLIRMEVNKQYSESKYNKNNNYCDKCEKYTEGVEMIVEKQKYFICSSKHKTRIKS